MHIYGCKGDHNSKGINTQAGVNSVLSSRNLWVNCGDHSA